MFADKLSMAHGLEVRVPYLDKEIVEYVQRLPAKFKVHNGQQKRLHRQVCQGILPAEILRRKKRGFAVNVVDDWFRGTMKGQMEDILMDRKSLLYQYLRPSVVQRVFKEHQSGRNDYHKILFSLVVFEEWLRVQSSTALRVGEEVTASY
jgi:asparagine synthase (glutamine-hydrolysing)